MATPEQSPGSVRKSPLASGISAETERLLGCLLTPKDSITNNTKPSVEWKNRVHTATGASSKTGSEHSGASNVRLVVCMAACTATYTQPGHMDVLADFHTRDASVSSSIYPEQATRRC